MTSGLNKVRVSGVVCVFTPDSSAPYGLRFPSPVLPALPPLFSTQPTPLFPPPPPPPLFLPSHLSFLLTFTLTSLLTIPAFSTVKTGIK
ncbi:unnamed protein product [Schistocephalus solidus]|uniref:Uncharacterized protein n=1 Tax=Schistocephalus solidus TaxID=70667 RepID=A0A183SZS4_SCHSO|nr:unnamed protein product [Schistocephalus solidus]